MLGTQKEIGCEPKMDLYFLTIPSVTLILVTSVSCHSLPMVPSHTFCLSKSIYVSCFYLLLVFLFSVWKYFLPLCHHHCFFGIFCQEALCSSRFTWLSCLFMIPIYVEVGLFSKSNNFHIWLSLIYILWNHDL